MLRTRMFTPGFKLFFGIAAFLLFGAVLFGMSSSLLVENATVGDRLGQQGIIQTVTGPLTIGWKGPVGNHIGYGLLLAAAGIAAYVACVLVAFRDADPEAEAQVLDVETVPLTRAPSGTNFAPLVGALALGLVAIGWVLGSFLFYAGLALLVITAGAWTVRAWAERATGDAEVNHQIYARLIDPLRVPVVGALLIAFVVVGLSRVLLAVPDQNWSRVIFGVVAVVFFGGVLAVAAAPRIARPLATGLLALAAAAVLIGGIWGVAAGERPVEPHESGHEGEVVHTSLPGHEPASGTQEGGLAPAGARAAASAPTGGAAK
jgi:hypothetical protein